MKDKSRFILPAVLVLAALLILNALGILRVSVSFSGSEKVPKMQHFELGASVGEIDKGIRVYEVQHTASRYKFWVFRGWDERIVVIPEEMVKVRP